MVKATIKWEDGTEHTLYAKDMIELFTMNTFQSEEANEVVVNSLHGVMRIICSRLTSVVTLSFSPVSGLI